MTQCTCVIDWCAPTGLDPSTRPSSTIGAEPVNTDTELFLLLLQPHVAPDRLLLSLPQSLSNSAE